MTSEPDRPAAGPSPQGPMWRLVAALAVVLAAVALFRFGAATGDGGRPGNRNAPTTSATVLVTVRQPDVSPAEHVVAWREGLTVETATRDAGLDAEWRGEGEMAFLESLGGESNQGPDGLNWQFEVNGVYATRGAGATTLAPGDRVLWKLAPYE